MVNDYHSELCWLIREFCVKSKFADKLVQEFIEVNSLSCIEDCENIMALETVLRVEIFMSKFRDKI